MKKFLLFICACVFCIPVAEGAVRGENTTSRGKSSAATTTARATRSITSRTPLKTTVAARSVKPVSVLMPKNSSQKTATRTTTRNTTTRNVSARATTAINSAVETRTGTEYEQCKTAFFTCMDHSCYLKSDV